MLEVLFMPSGIFDSSHYGALLEDNTPATPPPPTKRRRVMISPDIYNYLYETHPPSPPFSPFSSHFPDESSITTLLLNQQTNISHLPNELLDHIISFLPISVTRTHCRLVCKSWDEIVLSPQYWRDFALPRTTGIDVEKYINILSLPRFSQLHTVVFGWDHKVDDDIIARLFDRNPHLFSSLQTLEVQRCHGVSDNSMKIIATSKHLQHLRLYNSSNWRGITNKGIEELSKLSSLKILQLNYFKRITNDGLSKLSTLTSLRELLLIGSCQITDQGIKSLTPLHDLSYLAISLCGTLTDNTLHTISVSFPSLTTLALGYNNPNSYFTDAGLLNLLSLSKLKELRLERTWGLLHGAGARELKSKITELQIKQW